GPTDREHLLEYDCPAPDRRKQQPDHHDLDDDVGLEKKRNKREIPRRRIERSRSQINRSHSAGLLSRNPEHALALPTRNQVTPQVPLPAHGGYTAKTDIRHPDGHFPAAGPTQVRRSRTTSRSNVLKLGRLTPRGGRGNATRHNRESPGFISDSR